MDPDVVGHSFGKYKILVFLSFSAFMDSKSPLTRKLDLGESEESRPPKRTRVNESSTEEREQEEISESILPPSHVLLGTSAPSLAPDGLIHKILETDVGISEYIARDIPKISGIIKQRYSCWQLLYCPVHVDSIYLDSRTSSYMKSI